VTKKNARASKPPVFAAFPTIEINPGFRRALDIMEGTDRHVFITGKAGTGKSTLLEFSRSQTLKRIGGLQKTSYLIIHFFTTLLSPRSSSFSLS
jgi:predicted ATPase